MTVRSPTAPAVTLRPLRQDDVPAAHALTTSFGWPHRKEDWAFATRLAQGVAAERDGALAGTALAWQYGSRHAALGLVGVSAACQGQGIGRRLMQAVLDALGERTVVLHATEAGAPLYRALGFVAEGSIHQHQGLAPPAGPAGQGLRPLTPGDRALVLALDAEATGMNRTALLDALLQDSGGAVLERGGAPVGVALWRRFGRGTSIGPVVAPDADAAQALIAHAMAQHAGQFVRLDVPGGAVLPAWLAGLGLPDVGPAIRMVRGTPPQRGPATMFALASQAFG